ncbi:tetratricopeptide repeat protein [Methylocapsa palsarum]|uniref:Sel1 repeat-containing protein n=1 Tax=Methylocapsa palsarum TaxID=1612308 RepID=A0A1I3WYA4_9HYPH|nr:tetratricopeptide repeat protein [Methylocapsa palsarum]SFK11401.1 Sel1 repeat-containing protein [Methylocapsa palsarum]
MIEAIQSKRQAPVTLERNSRLTPYLLRRATMAIALGFIALFGLLSPAAADRLVDGKRAFDAHNYVRASEIFLDMAAVGDPQAQTYLGYMYANGKGVPQNYVVSAAWYRCASQQGVPTAQYMLGLMYDKGQGVPQDYVTAYALVNLAVAGAGREREHWAIIRDALLSKLTLNERLRSQEMAFAGTPQVPCLPMVTGFGP